MLDLSILAEGLPEQRGPLGLLSGDEFGPKVAGFDRALLEASGSAASGPKRVGLIVCADHRAGPRSALIARAHFRSLGADIVDADVIHGEAHPEADLYYLGGGSPAELLACLRGSPRWTDVTLAWEAGAGLAGASAGAMALCAHSLEPREGDRMPTRWTSGLGPVRSVALAVHASSRPVEWLHGVARAAPVPLLALDDHTGVVVTPDGSVRREGPGDVWFV